MHLRPLWTIGRTAAAALVLIGCDRGPGEPAERSVDPSSIAVLPTFDAPLSTGKSAVWCASFEVAWNRLAKDVVKGPPQVRGAEELCRQLNEAAVGEADLPEKGFYAAAGWAKDGIGERIRKEMAAAFPAVPAPDLGGTGAVAVAYAYLEAGVKFGIPFFESRQPLAFKDSAGRETRVAAFGIREEDDYAYDKLRAQVEVLYREAGSDASPQDRFHPSTIVIDPCKTSEPVQMVLARVAPKASLAGTVGAVEEQIAGFRVDPHFREIGPNDVLLIPNVLFRLVHHFQELEGKDKPFLNPGMEGNWIAEALQSIRFRLDRSGAELQSEAKVQVLPIPTHFLFDGPFLVYLKKRAGGRPFFALWIDGADILQKWPE